MPKIVRFELSVRSVVLVVVAIAAVWMLLHLLTVLLVLVAALMLVGALNPLVDTLERRGIGRGFGIGIVFTSLVAAIVAFLVLVLPALGAQLWVLAEHAPEHLAKLVDKLEQSRVTAPFAESLRSARIEDLMKASQATLFSLGAWLVQFIAAVVAVIFLAIYIMIDRDRLRGALFAVVVREHHVRLSRILLKLETIVGGYIRGQVITCVLMTSYILVVLLACGVPNALAIACFGGLVDLLPFIGLVLTMVPAVAAALAKGPAIAITVFILLFLYEELEGRLLIPVVYGRALRLPSSVIVIALLVGSALAGIVGALLALPMAATILMLIDELRVELPGETEGAAALAGQRDARTNKEYERRTKDLPATEAAAVAIEIARKSSARKSEVKDVAK